MQILREFKMADFDILNSPRKRISRKICEKDRSAKVLLKRKSAEITKKYVKRDAFFSFWRVWAMLFWGQRWFAVGVAIT